MVGTAGFFLGPSLLVYLERKDRLPRGLVWLYSVFFVPVAVLFMSLIASPQDYCNDPLPHEAFRPFYVLFLPLIPLYVHYARAARLNHPFLMAFILTALSLGVFSLTVGYDIFHLAYQSTQGHGVIYSGARAWECAYLISASEITARQVVGRMTLLFLVVQIIILVLVRMLKRRQHAVEATSNGPEVEA